MLSELAALPSDCFAEACQCMTPLTQGGSELSALITALRLLNQVLSAASSRLGSSNCRALFQLFPLQAAAQDPCFDRSWFAAVSRVLLLSCACTDYFSSEKTGCASMKLRLILSAKEFRIGSAPIMMVFFGWWKTSGRLGQWACGSWWQRRRRLWWAKWRP